MSGSQACRGSPHGPIEKEMCQFKAEKNKSSSMFTEPDTFSLFCLLISSYLYFLFILLPHFVLIIYVLILQWLSFSVDGHHLAFLYDRT